MSRAGRQRIAAIGLCLIGLGIAFQREIASAVAVWDSSTAYGHCWLVLPIAGWLLWERRAAAWALPARPVLWPALLAVPLVAAWVLADLLGIMEGRQLALIGFVELVLLAALGWRLWWALSPALLYLFFLVPFGAFLTHGLQHFTTSFILGGLEVLDIPYQATSFQITIPEGVFFVAEACAGLRFLIASVAFGVLYALTMFRSPWRRVIYIAVACVVPVVANGFRGLGIVVLGHLLGSAEAGAADHLIYGWVFFSVVILALALGGFPFRQAPASPPVPVLAAPVASWHVWPGCVAVLLLGWSAPLLEAALAPPPAARSAAAMPAFATPPAFAAPAGCTADVPQTGQGRERVEYACEGQHFTLIAIPLAAGRNPAAILGAGRDAALTGLGTDIDSEIFNAPAPWIILTARDTGRASAYSVLAGGRQMVGSLHDRLAWARAMFGGGAPTVAVAVRMGVGPVEDLRAFLRQVRK